MNKKMVLGVFLFVMLTALISCASSPTSGGPPGPLEGTWETTNQEGTPVVFTFQGSSATQFLNGNPNYRGKLVYKDSMIQIQMTDVFDITHGRWSSVRMGSWMSPVKLHYSIISGNEIEMEIFGANALIKGSSGMYKWIREGTGKEISGNSSPTIIINVDNSSSNTASSSGNSSSTSVKVGDDNSVR